MHSAASFRTRSRRESVSPQLTNLDRMASRRSFMMLEERRESRLKDEFNDHVSETSSAEERRFAELLGSDSESDMGGGMEAGNVGERLYITGTAKERRKQERLQREREKVLLKELNEVTTKPRITHHARWKPSKGAMFAEHAIEWENRRREKLEESARKAREEEGRELMPSPHINRRSAEIAASRHYQGPVSGWEDHFAKYCAKKAAQQNQAPQPGMFSPNINRYKGLDASRTEERIPIGDRLFEESFVREDRLREMEEMQREQELVDEFTNRPLFTPSTVEYPLPEERAAQGAAVDAGARLHALHNARLERRRQTQASSDSNDASTMFSPKVNKHSQEIGDRRRKPLYHNKVDYHKEHLEAEERERALGFKPSINASPRTTSNPPVVRQRAVPTAKDFVHRNEALNRQRQARLAKIKEEALEHQSRECTFQPSVNRRSMEIFQSINRYGTELMDAPSLRYQAGGASELHSAARNRNPESIHRSGSNVLNGTSGVADSLNATRNGASMMMMNSGGVASPAPKPQLHQHQQPHRVDPSQRQPQYPIRSPSGIDRSTPGKSLPVPSPGGGERYSMSRGNSGVAGPSSPSQHQQEDLSEYVEHFQRQMFQVMDEWRRLEDV